MKYTVPMLLILVSFSCTRGIEVAQTENALLRGTYVTIWEKTDGIWKFVLDTGNQGLGE